VNKTREKTMNAKHLLDYSIVAAAEEHQLNLLVKLQGPARPTRRRPLNLGVVLDRSGSMAGEKLVYAKEALNTLITHLGPDDRLSVVLFDSRVEVALEPSAVRDKDALKQQVDAIEAGSCTNLSGGWIKGLELVGAKPDKKRLSRVLLLTDGQANEGIVAPEKLVALGRSAYTRRRIVTTALGFGLGFNEDLLDGIARQSGGRFHFIETADAAPAVFRDELEGLLALVAQNIEVRVTLREPVRYLRQWTDYAARQNGNTVTFLLGDAYADEEKRLLLSLHTSGLCDLGEQRIADVALSYSEITETAVTTRQMAFPVTVNVADRAAAAVPPEPEVLQQLGLQMAAEGRRRAIAEADQGDYAKARKTLARSCAELRALPNAADPQIQEELQALAEQAEALDESQYYGATRKRMVADMSSLSLGQYDKLARERRRRATPTGQVKKI
jgi:Ca-activated chloride channel family protein